MKVVIFCGGFGVRMGEETTRVRKPQVRIGDRAILWHVMRNDASSGHRGLAPWERARVGHAVTAQTT